MEPDPVPERIDHSETAAALARSAGDALENDDANACAALTALAQAHALLAMADVQQQTLWVMSDIRTHLESLRFHGLEEISRALRERAG
jgi:Leu/Phe-tRNA-protein transferase